jgi:hypothetical protein
MDVSLMVMSSSTELRDEDVLTYGLRYQKVKAAVKKSLTR